MSDTQQPRTRGEQLDPVTLEVIYLPRATRISRAVLIMLVALVVAPGVFFLPPHFLWPLLVLGAGGYLAWRYWTGEYYVVSFEGACPRCGNELELPQNSRIRATHAMECYSCHRQPTLVLDEPRD